MTFQHLTRRQKLRRCLGLPLAAGVLALAVSIAVQAADPPAKPVPAVEHATVEATVADLVKLVGEGRIDQMLDRIGPVPDPDREEYEKTRERLIAIYGNAGKYSGFDIAGVKTLTPRYQVEYVLVYFAKRPVLFEFGFYMVDGKWRAQHLSVGADLKELLDTMPLQK